MQEDFCIWHFGADEQIVNKHNRTTLNKLRGARVQQVAVARKRMGSDKLFCTQSVTNLVQNNSKSVVEDEICKWMTRTGPDDGASKFLMARDLEIGGSVMQGDAKLRTARTRERQTVTN